MITSDSISLLFRATGDTSDAKAAFRDLRTDIQKSTSGISLSGLNSSFASLGNQISGISTKLKTLGSGISSLGKTMSVALTVPVAAAGYALAQYGFSLDELRNQMTAFEGSAEKGEARLKSLRSLVDQTAGSTREGAYAIYGLLKPLQASDKAIDSTVEAIGRLKLGFKNLEPSDFTYNLTQIFGQNFEEQDIKQAIGQVPKFREYLLKAFGTSDNEELRKLKESGKITMESFFTGFAEAVENDSVLSGLQEPVRLRMQKFFERAFEAVEPLANRIVEILAQIIETASPYIEQFGKWFSELSPVFQNLIIIFGVVAAAIGPVLIVLGSLITAIGSVAGAVAFVVGSFTTIAPIAAGVVIALAALGTAAYGLYQAWQTNFGGIRDFTKEVFEKIKDTVLPILTDIYDFVQSTGGKIVEWWEDNYPLIEETVKNVSENVRAFVRSFLDTVYGFWKDHGEGITSVVSNYYNAIKTNISNVIDLLGNILKLGMQIINGDWDGAWATFLEVVRGTVATVGGYIRGFRDTIGRYLLEAIKIAAEFIIKFNIELVKGITKAVVGAAYALATLPARIGEIVPKLYAAGRSIAEAIWQGIKDALYGRTVDVPVNPVPMGGSYGNADVIDSGSFDSGKIADSAAKRQEESEKARKEREKLAERNASAMLQIWRNYSDELTEIFKETFDKQKEQFQKTGDGEGFRQAVSDSIVDYIKKVGEANAKIEQLENAAADKEKKTANERFLLKQQQQKREAELIKGYQAVTEEAEELITETVKKESEKRVEVNRENLEAELEQQENIIRAKQAYLDSQYAQGLISERNYQESKRKLILDYSTATVRDGQLQEIDLEKSLFNSRRANLQKQLEAAKGNAEKEFEIRKQLSDLWAEIQVEYFNQEAERAKEKKQSLEEEVRLAEELVQIQRQLSEVERERIDFRQDQERKRLENTVDASFGKARRQALEQLRDFELAEAERKRIEREIELETEKQNALDRIRGKENEEEQKFRIEELYKEKKLLSEEEFQERLKEIKDSFKNTGFSDGVGGLGQAISESIGSIFGDGTADSMSLFASLGDILTQSLNAMAQAAGNAVAAFVKFGSAGGSFRKFAAEIIASIAQMATVQAVWNLAEGFAKLALAYFGHPTAGASATQHFIAAGVYGSIAGVAAIAGRAIAGDSFKQEAAGGFGSSSSSFNSNQNNQQDDTIRYDENRIGRQEAATPKVVEFRIPQGVVERQFINDFNSAGPMRDVVLRMVET